MQLVGYHDSLNRVTPYLGCMFFYMQLGTIAVLSINRNSHFFSSPIINRKYAKGLDKSET